MSSEYFDAMGITVMRGRTFSAGLAQGAPTGVVVNQAFVKSFLADRDPLGAQLTIDDGPRRSREIMGVVGDVRHFGLDRPPAPTMYVSHLDRPWHNMFLVSRAERGSPSRQLAGIRQAVAALDGRVVPAHAQTMRRYLEASTGRQRFTSYVLGGFAMVALLLAALGLHGVVAYSVTERTHEIAVRLALGAEPLAVSGLIVGHALRLLVVGLTVGAALSLVIARLLRASFHGVGSGDLAVLVAVAVLLTAVVLAACYAPARRAARVDPMDLIRL